MELEEAKKEAVEAIVIFVKSAKDQGEDEIRLMAKLFVDYMLLKASKIFA